MGTRYGQTGTQGTNTTTDKTMLGLTGGTGVLLKIYDWIFGPNVTPSDGVFIYVARRTTAAGTSTSVTPEPLDADRALAAEATCGSNHTGEPTYAGVAALSIPLFSKATQRWQAAPGGELITALTANNGFGFASRSPTLTTATRCTVHHEE